MTRRLAILDDHPPGPGYDANRDLLVKLLGQVGIVYQSCLHVGPDELAKLAAYQPHMVLVLDWQRDKKRSGLLALMGEKKAIDDWRGSVLLATQVVPGTKLMATYHPNRLKVEWGLTGVVRFDMKRLAEELQTDTLDVPADDIEINLTKDQLIERLRDIYENDRTTAPDIEGYPDWITCIGFATGPNKAFVVPLIHEDGTSWWSEEDELELLRWVAKVLEKPTCQKRMHNGSYEVFCLAWSYDIVIEGFKDDTMLLWFELFCELEKNLGFVASILTKQPWYKHQRKSTDESTQLYYNGRDCCRTFEVCDKMLPMLKPKQAEHYRFNMEVLVPINFMALRGMRYDAKAAEARLAQVQQEIYELQDQINREAASGRPDLRAFYAALDGGGCQAGLPGEAACQRLDTRPGLVSLFTQAFCKAESLRRERKEVEEVWWQPVRWNGKRWVKAGKRLAQIELGSEIVTADQGPLAPRPLDCGPGEPNDLPRIAYLRQVRQVTKLVPVAIQTFEDVKRFALGSKKAECSRAVQLVIEIGQTNQRSGLRGELATLLGIHVKISASGRDKDTEQADGTTERGDERDANWFLYEHCKLPKQWVKEGNRNTDRLASDEEAVIKAWIASGPTEAKRDPRALTFIALKKKLTESKALRARPDPDGRIRCSYNLVGTETHRLSCSGSPTRSSRLNLQTITKKHRAFYLADEGHVMCQRDLSGADGWTVAAYAAMLGDPTMLLDYRAKLKPAQVVVLMLDQGSKVNLLSREELAPLCKPITEEADWRYFGMKRVQHGSSYQMGKRTMSDQILTDSFKKDGKPIYMDPATCQRIQEQCFFVRYPGIRRWHQWMQQELLRNGTLTASNGFSRRFYGRKNDSATVRAALGHLPQVYTTYATCLALHRLWTDPDNWREDGSLKIEPLHTVHDSLICQWPDHLTEWAKVKMADYFNNSIQIANETVVIPASGTYGPSWGQQDQAL